MSFDMPVKRYVMIVDDDMDVNEIVAKNLEKHGYGVISIFDGEEAFRATAIIKPDLILLDLDIPGFSGEQIYEQLKGEKETENIPIIIISGEDPGRIRNMGKMKNLSEEDIFLKPINYMKLLRRLEKYFPDGVPRHRKNILIAEDDRAANEILVENVCKQGYMPISVFDGDIAIQAAREKRPDLILLDINLPSARGELVYTALKNLKGTSGIPIIIVSGVDPVRVRQIHAGKNIDIRDIFIKPVDYDKLNKRIRQVLKDTDINP